MRDEDICKENKKLKKHLKELTVIVKQSLNSLDAVMKDCHDEPLGKYVAQIANHIELANDRARYFGLGIDYRKDKKTTITIEQETLRRVGEWLRHRPMEVLSVGTNTSACMSVEIDMDDIQILSNGQTPEGWEE